jgi:hypothetical protein
MEFCRARENNLRHIKYNKSFIHNTALIASEGEKVVAILEYEIKNIEEAEVVNFNIIEPCEEMSVFKGLIDEMSYWNPYLKRIIYNEDNNFISSRILLNSGFEKNSAWKLNIENDIQVFKIVIKEITPEQLTIDKVKLNRVNSWIEKPEDIVISCVKIDDKIVSIDGHSRLVAAYNKGFAYVYAYLELDDNTQFYKTCMKWCEEQGVLTIEDLAKRVVTPEEHERIWINRCQTYLKQQRDEACLSNQTNL